MIGDHQNLNGWHDLTTPLLGMICHAWAGICDQLAYQFWSLYPRSLRRYLKGYKMWKMEWFEVVRVTEKSAIR